MKKYLVALCTGGVVEQPDFLYIDHQIIKANTEAEAEKKYNKKNNCHYWFSSCIGEVVDDKVLVDLSYFNI